MPVLDSSIIILSTTDDIPENKIARSSRQVRQSPKANDAFSLCLRFFPYFKTSFRIYEKFSQLTFSQKYFCVCLSTKIFDDPFSHQLYFFRSRIDKFHSISEKLNFSLIFYMYIPLFSFNLRLFCIIYVFFASPYFDRYSDNSPGHFPRKNRPI